MKKIFLIIGFLFLPGSFTSVAAAKKCDRPCLVSMMDQYLTFLVKHDAAFLPLAPGAKLVENLKPTPIGKGLWETATGGPTEFKIYVADPLAGQVGFMGVIQDRNKPAILGARLKVINGQITEIDHMVVGQVQDPLPEGLIKPRPGLVTPLDPSERTPREQMLKAANSYYDAIEKSDGTVAPFADECQRHENGITSANNQDPPPPATPGKKEDPMASLAIFGRMKCGEQLSTGVMGYITRIDQRRLFAVDEDMGLVYAFSMFNHSGEPKVLKIKGVPGITERPNTWGAFNLAAAHIYKIKKGKIYDIEAIGIGAAYQAKDGWR